MSDELKDYIEQQKEIKSIKKLYNIPLDAFDEFERQGIFGGGINKQFARCNGSYLMDMFFELRKDRNHYVTCVDDLIYDKTIDSSMLKKSSVSCIIKESDKNNQYSSRLSELIASRLANEFGINTEFVQPINGTNSCYLIIDFIKTGQSFESFRDYFDFIQGVSFYDFSNNCCVLEKFMKQIPDCLRENLKSLSPIKRQVIIKKFLTDFVKQYIFKKYIIHDADICSVNAGVILTNDNNIVTLAPAFDYEQSFNPGKRISQAFGLEEDLEFLADNYPFILMNVKNTFAINSTRIKNISKIFERFDKLENRRYDYYNLVINSAIAVRGYAEKYLSEKESLRSKEIESQK